METTIPWAPLGQNRRTPTSGSSARSTPRSFSEIWKQNEGLFIRLPYWLGWNPEAPAIGLEMIRVSQENRKL